MTAPDQHRILDPVWQHGLVFVVQVAIALPIALHLQAQGAFNDFNRLFDADPNTRLPGLAHGWSSDEGVFWALPGSIHALLPYLFSPLIRSIAWLSRTLQLIGEVEPFRLQLALFVAPLLAAFTASAMSWLHARLGAQGWRLAALNVLNLAAFSNLLFASIPDHFVITRLLTVLMFCLIVAANDPTFARITRPLWLVLSILASGVTITNGAAIAIGRYCHERFSGAAPLGAAVVAIRCAALGLVIALVVGVGLHVARYGMPEPNAENFVTDYSGNDGPVLRSAKLIAAIGESVAPTRLVDATVPTGGRETPAVLMASKLRVNWQDLSIGLAVLALAAWGAWCLLHRIEAGPRVVTAAFLLLALNLVLFGLWGHTLFVYSQHWMPALQIGFTGLAVARSNRFSASTFTLLALTCASVAASIHAWIYVFRSIAMPAA